MWKKRIFISHEFETINPILTGLFETHSFYWGGGQVWPPLQISAPKGPIAAKLLHGCDRHIWRVLLRRIKLQRITVYSITALLIIYAITRGLDIHKWWQYCGTNKISEGHMFWYMKVSYKFYPLVVMFKSADSKLIPSLKSLICTIS